MVRARRAGRSALALIVAVGLLVGPPARPVWPPTTVRAAVVAWPASTLVVSEVQTGGASASDEFVEIANQGAAPVDLLGLEVVYATSTGSTVTRKGTWTSSLVLDPGRRALLVNGSGAYAGVGDLVYTGGFAATGGAIALRVVGGAVVDSVGWGDASSGFVEGLAAAAPTAGSSLERRPGGSAGNGLDTNDNATDFVVNGTPGPQSLAAPPVPSSPTATPTPTAVPTATPTPTRHRPRLRPWHRQRLRHRPWLPRRLRHRPWHRRRLRRPRPRPRRPSLPHRRPPQPRPRPRRPP